MNASASDSRKQGREKPEGEHDKDEDARRTSVEVSVLEPGHDTGDHGLGEGKYRMCHQGSEASGDEDQESRFGHDLTDQSNTVGAQCGPGP